MLNYTKLWMLLESRGMKKTDLKQVISSVTLAKLSKNETISSDTIEKICGFLNCQPGDIMEYISDEQITLIGEKVDMMNRLILEQLKAHGVTEDMYKAMLTQFTTEMANNMFNGGTRTLTEISQEVIDNTIGKKE